MAVQARDRQRDDAYAQEAQLLRRLWPEATMLRGVGQENTVQVAVDAFADVRRRLRDHTGLQYRVLTDRTAVDYPSRVARFQVSVQLRSLAWNRRRTVSVAVDERTVVPTLCGVYPAANWYEREVYDRFGVVFAGHPDRRRMLTDYGFEGHPLRKDFPLSGFTEVRYDESEKRVVCEPLELSQERRLWEVRRPWAEGDRKAVRAEGSGPKA